VTSQVFQKGQGQGPKNPDVSIAIGVKVRAGLSWAYFVFFLSSVKAAMAPASLAALDRYKGAKHVGQVASCTRQFAAIPWNNSDPIEALSINLVEARWL